MKKFTTLAMLLSAVIAGTAALAACGKTHEKGAAFAGALTETAYASTETAVEAFVAEQFGESFEIVKSEKKSDVNDKTLASLPLGEHTADEVTKAELWTVYYQEAASAAPTALSEEEADSHDVYLLAFGTEYRYLTPPTPIGSRITKAYWEDVLDAKKYVNCTMTGNTKYHQSDENYDVGDAEINITESCTESAIFMKQKSHENHNNGEIYDIDYTVYMIKTEDGWAQVYQYSDSPNDSPDWEIEKVDDFDIQDAYFGAEFLSYPTYAFYRTKDGFTCTDKKLLAEFFDIESSNLEGEVAFKIKDGYLTEYKCDLSEKDENGKVIGSEQITISYSKFGTTKVDIPAEIKAMLD